MKKEYRVVQVIRPPRPEEHLPVHRRGQRVQVVRRQGPPPPENIGMSADQISSVEKKVGK